jgi:two-component system heavy metal sensor histidine kinase CusS
MGERLPVALFPAPAAAADSPESVGRHARHHGSFLLVSVTAPVGTDGRETRTLQAALDISLDTALLADYRRKLLAVLALGIAFAGVAGVWVASRGLRPMAEITKTARHISATQLHERITASQWPSELAELAAAFNAMLNRLEDSFTRLSQFSADLAHELRTPINNLRGEAEVALARARTPQEYQEILASSLEEYERLARMMDGLLFLARADNPDAAVERGRFDARKEIEAVREFYEALAAEQRVAVDCEGQATLAGDPVLFRRAVGNLLANALRHTPANGTVTLTARALDDGSAAITVRDTGSGIAPEHLPRIFDRFYRADPARSDVARGTGLGLAIVQSIMRLHGGAASVQSMPGRGTVVTLKFPAGGPLAPPEQMTKM